MCKTFSKVHPLLRTRQKHFYVTTYGDYRQDFFLFFFCNGLETCKTVFVNGADGTGEGRNCNRPSLSIVKG